jgi:hypothetical protein
MILKEITFLCFLAKNKTAINFQALGTNLLPLKYGVEADFCGKKGIKERISHVKGKLLTRVLGYFITSWKTSSEM